MNDNILLLKSGYTKNIKNPVLFNKILSKPVLSKVGSTQINELNNGSLSKVYIKLPAQIDVRLYDKIIEEIEEFNNNQSMSISGLPYWVEDEELNTAICVDGINTNLVFKKIPVDELSQFLSLYQTMGLNIDINVNDGDEYIILTDIDEAFGDYTLQTTLGWYNSSNVFQSEDIPLFKEYDSENDDIVIKINDLIINGFTEDNTTVSGLKENLYYKSGSKAVDLPSEESLENNTIKKGTTFKDKFEAIESSVNDAINSIDLSPYLKKYNSDSSQWIHYSSDISNASWSTDSYSRRPVTGYAVNQYAQPLYSARSGYWDTTPISGSTQPVTSNGIYNAIDSAKKDIKKSIEPNINFYSYKEGFISLDFSNTSKWESFIDGMTENYEYSFINSDSSKDNLFKKTKLYIDITNKIVVNEIAFIAEQNSNSDGFIFANIYNFSPNNVKFNVTAANSSGMTNGINVEVSSSGSKTVNSNSVKSFYYSAYMNGNNEVVVYGNSAPTEVTSSICVCPIYGIYNNGTNDVNKIISEVSRKIGNIYPNAFYKIKDSHDFEELIYEYEQLGSNYYSYLQNDFLCDQYFISNVTTRGFGIAMNNMYLSMSAPTKSLSSINKSYLYNIPYQKEFITSFGKLLKSGDTSTGFYFIMTFQNGGFPRMYITPIVEGNNITISSNYRYFNYKGNSSESSTSSLSLTTKTYEYGKWYMYDNNIYPQAFNEVDISEKTFCVIPSSDATTNGTYNYDVFKYTDNEETKEVDFTHIFVLSKTPTSVKDVITENQEKIAALENGDLKNKTYDSSAATIQTLQQVITNLQSQINDILNGNLTINATLTTSGYFDIKMPYFKNILKTDVTLTEHQTEGVTDYYIVEYDVTPLINLSALSNFEVYKPEIDFNDSTKSYFDETTFEISDSGVGSAREIKLTGKCSVAGYSALQNDSVIFDEVRIYMRAIDNTIEDQSNEGGE